MSKPKAISLLVDGKHGQFVPEVFVCNYDLSKWSGLREEDVQILKKGVDHEHFWEAWDSVLQSATYLNRGYTYRLHQDGDLWVYCDELMSDEEYENFWGEKRDE